MGFAKAAAAILQGVAPKVQDTYTNAANADAGYARGLGDQTQGAINQQAASDNAFLQEMGTPSGGLVHPANVGGTAYGLEGYIPASTLQREGAGFGAAAHELPGDVLSQGRQQASATLNDTTNIAQLQSELAKLAATKPEVYQKILTTLQDFGFKRAALNQAQQRIGISQQSLNLRAQYDQASLNLRAQAQAQTAFNENRNYKLALGRLGVSQERLQMEALKNEAKLKGGKGGTGGFTPDELVHIRGQSGKLAYSSFNGGVLSNGKPDPAHPALTYKQAFKLQILDGIPPSIAIKSLITAGYSSRNLKPGIFSGLGKYAKGVAGSVGQGAGNYYAHSSNAGGFLPKGQKFTYNRHDQGRDIQTRPGSPIIAPGAGYVVRWGSDPGGGGGHFGPRYPIVHFTSGPYAGQDVYIGHTVAAMRPGQHFNAGAVLSHTQNSGPLNGGAPSGWAEIGFAPGGSPGGFNQPAPF